MANPPPATVTGGRCTIDIGGFKVTRRGRYWVVKDPESVLVCVAVYKKGAVEVVRRLLPPDQRHLTESIPQWVAPRQKIVRHPARRYDLQQR